MTTRWFAFVVWAGVAVGAGAWAIHLFVPADGATSRTDTVGPAAHTDGDLTRVVGADLRPVAPVTAHVTIGGNRFRLVGVVAPGAAAPRGSATANEGIALIAIDGKPARAFHVGATVDGDTVLQEVSAFGATLGPRGGGTSTSLKIALQPAPAAEPAPVPTAESETVSQSPVDASMRSREILRSLASKHPTLQPESEPAAQQSVDATVESGDGRWTR